MKNLIILFGTILSNLALAEPISEQDKEFFIKESSSQYHSPISKIKTNKDLLSHKDIEASDVLYASLKINTTTEEAIKQFSTYFGIDEELGKVAAQELITAQKIEDGCTQKRHRESCPPTQLNLQNIQLLNESKKADDILFDIASTLHYRDEIPQVITAIGKNPKVLFKLFDYTEDAKYLAPLMEGKSTPNSILVEAVLKPRSNDTHPIDLIALDEFILKNNGDQAFEGKEEIQNNLIVQLLQSDLNKQAISLINEFSKGNLETYLKSKNTIFNCKKCPDITNDMIAYHIINRNIEEAAKIAALFPLKNIKNQASIDVRKFLLNSISSNITRSSLYYWMTYGNATGKKPNPKKYDDWDHMGWLSSLGRSSPIVRKAASQYFEKVNYPEFSRYMKEDNFYRPTRKEFPLAKGLGADYQNLVSHYENLVNTENSAWVTHSKIQNKEQNYRILANITEKKLPSIYLNKAAIEPDLKLLPTPLPISEDSIIRVEKFNEEWFVVYVSSALDPTGEIPAPGYWLLKSTRHGIAWGKPVYMGMQMHFPYEIVPNAAMPMMSETGIDLQANIKEIDTDSITFPPVGLFFKREKDNIAIHIALEDLFKDSDQDGLTDILETKIGSNPNDPDTDKDGFIDGTDTLPLTAFDKSSVIYNELGLLLLKKVVGIDQNAITVGVAKSSDDILTAAGLNTKSRPTIDSQKTLFLTGNKQLFSGLDIPFRLVFADEKSPANTGYALPTDIGWVFPNADHTEFYVIWSAHWAGGTFIVRVKKGKFEIEEISQWIT
jgi:hypothetical protein